MSSGGSRQRGRGGSGDSKSELRSGRPSHRLDRGMQRAQSTRMATKFTIETANKTLPLLRRIVSDAVRDYWRWQEKIREYEEVAANRKIDQPNEDADRLERETQQLARDIDGYIAEIRQLGVEMKGIDSGLVDFPSEVNGRPVLLCWQLGEESVQYWHEEDAGFSGRQPVTSLQGI